MVPGLVDMHQHLDKSRTRGLLSNPEGTLDGAIAAYRALSPNITREDMIARARGTVEACSACVNGQLKSCMDAALVTDLAAPWLRLVWNAPGAQLLTISAEWY